jgi:osmotically-inducible protein OsmY
MTGPANDAHLAQIVRSALGRRGLLRGVNVSSCAFVVTLHGSVEDEMVRAEIEAFVRSVEGVAEVVNKLRRNERDFAS